MREQTIGILNAATDTIEKQVIIDQWFSIEDKIPAENLSVIFGDNREPYKSGCFMGQWHEGKAWDPKDRTYRHVTHWQVLLAPPKK